MKKIVCVGYKLVLLLIPLVLSLLSCNGRREYDVMRIVEEWEGKEIIFPDSLSFMRYGIEPVDFSMGQDIKFLYTWILQDVLVVRCNWRSGIALFLMWIL